jgi:hypothetical protein
MRDHVTSETPGEVLAAGMRWIGKGVATLISIIFGLFVWAVAINIYHAMTGPVCELSNLRTEETVFPSKDGADYGFSVFTEVHNTGKQGSIAIDFELITSQGVFKRRFGGADDHDETKVVRADFQEPTLGATNVRSTAKCVDLKQ